MPPLLLLVKLQWFDVNAILPAPFKFFFSFLERCPLEVLFSLLSVNNSWVECRPDLSFLAFCSNFEVDYGSEEQASIVYKTLAAVDKEVNKLDNLLTESHLSAFMNSPISFPFVTS